MKTNYTCDWCGKEFSAGITRKDVLCPVCLAEYRAEQRCRNEANRRAAKKKKKPDISIGDIQSMAAQASSETGKYISYGKMVAGMR